MKYIIFDFDGTIGDSQSLIVKTLQDTMRARKLEVKSDEACAKTIGLRLDEAFVSLFGMSAEEGLECAATYREIFLDNKKTMIVKPFPSCDRNPESVAPSGLCSGNGQQQKPLLAGWIRASDAAGRYFSSIVAGDDVEHAKPAPDMVFKALKEMKGFYGKDETLVVGDMNFDVDMAHHAGCKACAVTYGNGTRQQLASAEWIIDDFAELLENRKRIN